MTKLFKHRAKKVGAPPGSLIYTGDNGAKAPLITLVLYNSTALIDLHPRSMDEVIKELREGYKVWIHVNGIHDPHLIDAIGRYFKLHPLLLEDIMNPSQRSKLDDYKDHLYIVIRILRQQHLSEMHLEDEQFSLVLGENFLLTFQEKDSDALLPIRERMQKPLSKMRSRGTDYLAYTILDMIVDRYFLILEEVDHSVELLEEELFTEPTPQTMQKIQLSKRVLALLRKTIWPMREVVNHFRRIDSTLVAESTRVYAHDVYDHTIQAIETVESFRDVTSGMLDIYLSTINQRLNEIMKVLTIVATIFVPLTFISSLYGMNFDYMPELHAAWGYPLVLSLMLGISLLMLWFFRRNRWI